MRVLFMGTPEFAVPHLEALLDKGYEIVAVLTQPDRPKGRHLRLTSPPAKDAAQKRKIPLFQPSTLKNENIKETLTQLRPDLGVVVAYGKILPLWLLSLPKYGCLNVHASLLPRYRGAAPIQRAIMEGRTRTGITIQLMEEGLDTGDILSQDSLVIEPEDTAGTVENKLSQLGPKLLINTIDSWVEGKISLIKQDEKDATYASKVEKEEAQIRWDHPAEEIRNLIRALNPHPGAYTFYKGQRLKVWQARTVQSSELRAEGETAPGTIIEAEDEMVVATATEALELVEVQPENRNKIGGPEFVRGYRVKAGERFEGSGF